MACLHYKKPNQSSPSSLRSEAKQFGDVIQCDVMWIRVGKDKHPILSVIDQATKYQVATLLPSERGEHLVHGLERAWVKHFGVPTTLCSDEGRGWVGDTMNNWTSTNSVNHEVAPGEAHTRLALVERRHQVLQIFFCCERLSASMARSLHLSFICIPQSTRALDQGGVEPRQAVSPKALRPWTIPLRYSVG